MLKVANGGHVNALPARAVFGLPHNYYYSSTKQALEIAPEHESRSRRASPLFFHIHTFPNGHSLLVQSLIPACFLMPGERIKFKPKKSLRKLLDYSDAQIDWQVIHRYMDRFENRERVI